MLRRSYRITTMLFLYFLLDIIAVLGFELNLPEKDTNKIDYDVTPLYQSIIIGDIADVMQDMDQIMLPPFGDLFHNTASDENVEDLLSEYQYYLDKAHKQRKLYMEKLNSKKSPNEISVDSAKKPRNKMTNYFMPNSEKMVDLKPFSYTYTVPSIVDLYVPLNTMPFKVDSSTLEPTNLHYDQETIKLTPQSQEAQSNEVIKPPRTCQMTDPLNCPCNLGSHVKCQENYKAFKKEYTNLQNILPNLFRMTNKNYKQGKNFPDKLLNNVINVHMKIDMQIPMNVDVNSELCPECSTRQAFDDNITPGVVNLPFPYFNIPPSFDDKAKVENYNTVHKNAIHKRKRNRQNGSKRHHKKLITFPNFNMHSDKVQSEEKTNTTDIPHNSDNEIHNEYTTENNNFHVTSNDNNTSDSPQELSLTVNLTFSSENDTDYQRLKYNNEETTESENKTTDESVNILKSRYRRDIAEDNTNKTKVENHVKETQNASNTKDIINDEELLYWPDTQITATTEDKGDSTKKIDFENKLFISKIYDALILNNNSKTLNAILIESIDWKNIEHVSSLFSTFVGKYFNGIVTLCSTDKCYSTKCHDKACVQITCEPTERHNQKGHCNKANSTENVKIMDSKMNTTEIPLDIANIFQEKLLDNTFGKGTICINMKCVTFIITKKRFIKTKCTTKTLNAAGHCPMKKFDHNI